MEKLYYSKGVSKAVLISSVASILLTLVIGISAFVMGTSKVEGPQQAISVGGTIKYISVERDRFDDDTQNTLFSLGSFVIIFGIVEAAVLILQMRSWTEISEDSIKANYMGKFVTCKTSGITDVTIGLGGHIIVTGPTGKIKLITNNPAKAQTIIKDLLFKQ